MVELATRNINYKFSNYQNCIKNRTYNCKKPNLMERRKNTACSKVWPCSSKRKGTNQN